MRGLRRGLLAVLLLLVGGSPLLYAQKAPKDSLFRLLEAERAEQYERFNVNYRLVQGHARFLHNDTYLLCDSASWNVDSKFIEAFGNVQVIQDKTMLKSEEMLYWIDDSRALFRGPLVELFDKDGNTLRTERLTYNTKDSVAVFEFGGSLKDKDGNVIESRKGTYDAKEGLFTFEEKVELYMDSVEIKTQTLRYFNETERAHFGVNTYVWRDQGFLRADGGWYDRPSRMIHFSDHVFMFDPTYDAWADEVYYNQLNGAVDLRRNAQVLDSTNKSVYLGDHMQYLPAEDTLSQRGWLTGNPAIIYYGENENHEVDTLFARADTFFVYSVPRCDIPKAEVDEAAQRLEDILFDALAKKRTEEAEQHEKERIQKMRDAGKLPPEWVEQQQKAEADSLAALARLDSLVTVGMLDSLMAASASLRASRKSVDSLISVTLNPPAPAPDSTSVALDSTSVAPDSTSVAPDSTSVAPDSTTVIPSVDSASVILSAAKDLDSTAVAPPLDSAALAPRDTTPIRYVLAWHNAKMYRSDVQAACDSMVFCELDSIARLYGRPILWNEVHNQLTAEEMQLLMKDGNFDRGSMITDAWLISEQDSVHYNQIKSTEMLGYFRDNQIYRFDALGGVTAIFYMVDEDVVTTVNLKESKSLTAALKDGTAQRLLYMESIKSDAYPVGELEASKQRLKGFEWRAEERPTSRQAITDRQVRTSERAQYEGMSKPLYRETNKYFDNYMYDLIEQINARKREELERRQWVQDSLAAAAYADSLAAVKALSALSDSTDVILSAAKDLDSTTVAPLTPVVVPYEKPDSLTQLVVPYEKPDSLTQIAVPFEKIDTGEKTVAAPATPASPETVVVSDQLTRAEKRALRKAERKARREARRAARLARRMARQNRS